MKTSSATPDENFFKITTFPCQCKQCGRIGPCGNLFIDVGNQYFNSSRFDYMIDIGIRRHFTSQLNFTWSVAVADYMSNVSSRILPKTFDTMRAQVNYSLFGTLLMKTELPLSLTNVWWQRHTISTKWRLYKMAGMVQTILSDAFSLKKTYAYYSIVTEAWSKASPPVNKSVNGWMSINRWKVFLVVQLTKGQPFYR